MTPIAEWLRETRKRHAMPENGRPWTQEHFLAQIREATGWAPGYANYNRYEQGKSVPRADTLQRIVDFWVSRGETAPDFAPQSAPDTRDPMTRLADAIEAQTRALQDSSGSGATRTHTEPDESLLVEAIDRQTAAIEAQTRMLALVLSRLVPGAGEPELDELAAQRMYDELRRPRSVPAPAKP